VVCALITENDLMEAIAECQGTRSPNANTCIKLAAYYIILDHMKQTEEKPTYSFAMPPNNAADITYYGDSDFAQKIYGMPIDKVLSIIDELMDTLSVLNPSLYNGVMRKLSE
jgi:hypothetical protein